MSKPLNRDLNPHKAAIVAMLLWNKNYAQSGRGSMNFFEHYLSESERQICREQVEKILKAPDESRRHKTKRPEALRGEMMSEKLEGRKTYEVPVQGGFNKNIEVNANSFKEAVQKVSNVGHKLDEYRFGKEK